MAVVSQLMQNQVHLSDAMIDTAREACLLCAVIKYCIDRNLAERIDIPTCRLRDVNCSDGRNGRRYYACGYWSSVTGIDERSADDMT